MKQWKGLRRFFFAVCVCVLLSGQTVFAETGGNDKSYTYTIILYSGNQGVFADVSGIQVDNHATHSEYQIVKSEQGNDKIRITGLQYGDRIMVNAQSGVSLKEASQYYVKGIRESGHDNNTVGASAFSVESDREYVIAYGIKGDMTSYVVNYQDTAGNTLAESQTFYGTVGEQPVVAFRYVEGYRPQAYNLTKTLSRNEAENVFTFVYEAASEQNGQSQGTGDDGANVNGNTNGNTAGNTDNGNAAGNTDNGNAAGNTDNGNAAGNTDNGNAAGNADNGNADNGNADNGNADNGNADGNADGNTDNGNADQIPADGNELVSPEEEQIPEELVNLDDEETPLADIDATNASAESLKNMPVWIGVAALLAGLGILFTRVWKKGKHKTGKKHEGETETEKEEKK